MRRQAAITGLLVATTLLVASWARADDGERAKALFDEGVAEMMAGNPASGCPKIGAAYVMTKGTGALFTLAECNAQWGKPAAALRHYRGYLKRYARLGIDERKRQEERAQLATTQVAALAAVVPSLRIVIADDDRRGATVTVDGAPVQTEALDGPLQLEVGTHHVVVTAADGRSVDQRFDLVEGTQRHWDVRLESAAVRPLPPQPPATTEWSPTPIAGFVVGGTGLAVLAVGAVTGGLAVGKRGIVDDHCTDRICDQEGLDAADSGDLLGNVSTATLVIGGAALATGIVLLAVGYRGDSTEALQFTPEGFRVTF